MIGQNSTGSELKSVAVSELKVGQAFSESVYIDEDNLLVPIKVSIIRKDLEMLETLGINTVYTSGEVLKTPSQEDAENRQEEAFRPPGESPRIDPSHSFTTIQENKSAYRVYTTLIERTNYLFAKISEGASLDNRSVNAISTQLLQALRNQREQFIGFVLGGEVRGRAMAKSAVNCAILSALTAQEIRLPSHKILFTIVGALLHDAGMFRLPRKLVEKEGELTEAERKQIRSHPLLSHGVAVQGLSYPEEIGEMVLQHHERWDGNGYPHRLPGDAISLGARIISIADSFEAMVSPRPYRDSIVGYQANKNLLADNSRRFDPDLLKVFILTMGVYPIGSIVCLNNGTIARVSAVRSSTPLRPKVQVLMDEQKRIRKNEEATFIDLFTEKKLYIVRAVDRKELSEMYA